MKPAPIFSSMLTILFIGIPGTKKRYPKPRKKTNPYFYLLVILPAIGVM